MLWCCVTPERVHKTTKIMGAIAVGWSGPAKLVAGAPPEDGQPFAAWGQIWLSLTTIPRALKQGRPFWYIDNGYYLPSGKVIGDRYYRVSYCGMKAAQIVDPPPLRSSRLSVQMKQWRKPKNGRHVLLALPSIYYGRAVGLDMPSWIAGIEAKVRSMTDRPIIVRRRDCLRPIEEDLTNCWALVTHSSNVAIDAVRNGIPVFVEGTSPAAPVGNLNLADMENPRMPDREMWWRSLMAQQFTLDEFKDGTARPYLEMMR